MKHNFVLRKDVVVSRELLYIFMKKIISDLEFNSKAVLGIYLHKVYLAVRVLLRGITSAKSQWRIVPGNASSVPLTLYFELGLWNGSTSYSLLNIYMVHQPPTFIART